MSKGGSSFTLHAPLELLARYGLLPLVEPGQREAARLQMVASAARYQAESTPIVTPKAQKEFPDEATAQAEFAQAFKAGQRDELESLMLHYAQQFGVASLVRVLTPLALPTLTGASHSHIGLWLLLRHGRTSDLGDAGLLRTASRSLSNSPQSQLRSFSGMQLAGDQKLNQTPEQIEDEITSKLVSGKSDKPMISSMQGLFNAGEATGKADSLFTDFIRSDLTSEQIDAAFRAVLRVCAHNMLQHNTSFSKFGWSHCLTLPQAACGLSSFNIDRKLALASTLVWITSYRFVMSDHPLDIHWTPDQVPGGPNLLEALQTSPTIAAARVWHADEHELPAIKQTLATQASIRTDQHLIKYTRACLDMVAFDPAYERLYLAAAAHLCGVWVKEKPNV